MALRGIVSLLAVYPEDYGTSTSPLYAFQNHFKDPYTYTTPDNSIVFYHNYFDSAGYAQARDEGYSDLTVTFAATADNVDLVDEIITNRYVVQTGIFRWTAAEGIDNPTTVFPLALHIGSVTSVDADFTSLAVKLSLYNEAVRADLPWRKIPWTILGPLSFRR